ncbi:hypothetical protein KR093_009314 [Drosophila rubida]|uniref:RING finger protein 17 n=1 Tax=Drosophila rubida TaxID=30044 RepID=A0AAD4JWE3_9MUSC|nr:hypothetical protein KR093_009314 [Drosophila rubida]
MISDDSGVKFFDRKFVAANLRSQLCCPNCSCEYSHRHYAGAENRLPFLLPCGHLMCELCISKHRQQIDFKCAVCFNLAPPTITVKDPKAAGNTRDYYELNYHVLGEANSLDYFRRYSVDSVNKSLQFSAMHEIAVETKCSECSHIAAKGECKQCNAFYCKRCFETVHNHSRVLKTHTFQHFADNNNNGHGANNYKGIRVGKNIFHYPMPLQCSVHKLPAPIFCRVCKRICCKSCKCIQSHHKTCLVEELNQRYAADIPASINTLDVAIFQVNNAQMVLKNTKKQLSDFADETLAGISEHFRLLHGQLQNAELQAIEMLRKSSLSPQMQLNEAMSELNGYELVLNVSIQIANHPIKRSTSVPEAAQNFWLKDVICLIHEHLEKIPTHVKITKIAGNPYYNTIKNLSELIRSHFITKFRDPQIEVHFSNEYNDLSSISAISFGRQSPVSPSDNRSPKNNFEAPQMDLGPLAVALPGRGQRQPSNCSDNSLEMRPQQLKFLRSFDELDISNDFGATSNSLANQVGDWFKTGACVRVRSINSPQDFYVQCIQSAQRMRDQLERFVSASDWLSPPDVIIVGQQYLIYLRQTLTDRWQRALVCDTTQSIIYYVFLPDIGAHQNVHYTDFRQLPEHLAMQPYASAHCSLKQLMPVTGLAEWEPKAGAFLKQVVQTNPVYVTVLRSLGPQFYEVDLTTKNYKTNISVREAFLYAGLAQAQCGYGLAELSTPQPQFAQASQKLPTCEPHVGYVLMVQLLEVQHPQDFYVMGHNNCEVHRDKQAELQRVMNGMNLGQLEPIYLGRLQLACALQWEGQWHRARIEQLLPNGYVLVRFVDTGAVQKLYWDKLFMLPVQFWHPEYAIKCCLADVEPLQKHGYAWTAVGNAAFKQLASNPQLHMQVISVHDKVAQVALHFTRSGSDSNNVAALLVAQGHCLSNGESSKVHELMHAKLPQLDADTRKLIELTIKEQPNNFEEILADKLVAEQRSAIEVLHVLHPGEFYVTLTHFMAAIADLRKSVQEAAVVMNETQEHIYRTFWLPGSMCYVWIKAKAEMNVLWHRGQIVAVADDTDVEYKYNVQLRDIGELVKMVPASCLLPIDQAMARVSNSALRCQLYGISAKDAEWSTEAIEFFKAQLNAYSALYVSGQGRDGDCLNVELWGALTEICGPFSPARTKYVSINEALVNAGWAVKDASNSMPLEAVCAMHTTITLDANSDGDNDDDDDEDEDDEDLSANLRNVDSMNGKKWRRSDINLLINKLNYFLIATTPLVPRPCLDHSFEHNDEMPPLELLQDFNDDTTTTGCTEPPLAWKTPRASNKSLFTALPTYVNHRCEVYLSLNSDKPFIKQMCKLLSKRFSQALETQVPGTYVVGQPVVVKYHLDNKLYRGIVKSKISSKGEYRVYYVDYGNVEKTQPSELLPFAPFPKLKAMCFLIALPMRPKQNKYDLDAMDMLHNAVVMRLSSIRVMESIAPNGLPMCQVKVDNEDVVTMMVMNGMAMRQTPHKKLDLALPRPELLESFKMFDELVQLGELSTPIGDEVTNNTTTQPPPAKKKFVMNNQQMKSFEFDDDFDCKEEALQQLQMSGNCENDSDASVEIMWVSEGNSNKEPDPETTSNVSSAHISAIDQVRLRIQLRNRQDRLETSHFSPMDTSTERSYSNDVGCFKAANLPTGVRQFKCSIDKVLSATELQISPKLSEFAKHEISLTQETSSLIKKAKLLKSVKLDALCLARYTLDNQWYRAIIKELHQSSKQATVFYIDFHDTGMVPLSDLKSMPKELFMFPQRTFRVKLHGIRKNNNFTEAAVRHSLQACLCRYPEVFARVHYPLNYNNNSDELSSDSMNEDSDRKGFQLLEVDVFADEYTTDLLYKPLIDSRMYLVK